MKTIRMVFSLCALLLSLYLIEACGGGASNSAPAATSAPNTPVTNNATSAPATATTAPTSAPNAVATTAPVSAPTTAANSGDSTAAIVAVSQFQLANAFRLDADAHVSRLFFGGRDYAGNGNDPEQVTVFSVKGEEKDFDVHYDVGGFLGSLMAVLSGFDPNSANLELARVAQKKYLHGAFAGAAAPSWYLLSDQQAVSNDASRFDPKELFEPIISGSGGPIADLVKTGSENLDNQSCDVYSYNRHEFDGVFPLMSELTELKKDKVDLSTIDSFEFKYWVCDDNKLHQVQYNFTAHDKTQPDQKGTFAYKMHIYDYDSAITVQAPPEAVPFGSGTSAQSNPTHTPSPTAATTSGYDGDWEGFNSRGFPFSFRVEDNQVNFVALNVSYQVKDCSGSVSLSTSLKNTPIKDDSFTATYTDSDNVVYTVVGKFTSPTQANGSIEIKGHPHSQDCKDLTFDAEDTWTAVDADVVGTPTPPPTETPNPEAQKDPRNVVLGFFLGVDFQQVDASVETLADESIKYAFGTTSGSGKADLKTYLNDQVKQGVEFKFVNGQVNVNDNGNVASFPLQVTGPKPTNYSCTATVVDGKITILTCK